MAGAFQYSASRLSNNWLRQILSYCYFLSLICIIRPCKRVYQSRRHGSICRSRRKREIQSYQRNSRFLAAIHGIRQFIHHDKAALASLPVPLSSQFYFFFHKAGANRAVLRAIPSHSSGQSQRGGRSGLGSASRRSQRVFRLSFGGIFWGVDSVQRFEDDDGEIDQLNSYLRFHRAISKR